MKTDPLEKFILNNKADFDELEPDLRLWENIEKQLPQSKTRLLRPFLLKAAAVAAIFIAGYFASYWVYQGNENQQYNDVALSEDVQLLQEAKAYYTGQIQERTDLVLSLAVNRPEMKEELKNEFNEMDKLYADLEKDFSDQIDNEAVIEAMIQHYRVKLELLEDMLLQLQASSSEKEKEVHYVL